MNIDELDKTDEFINRLKNFHFSKEHIEEITVEYGDIFGVSHLLCEKIKLDFGCEDKLSKHNNDELLDAIFSKVFEFILSNFEDEFQIVESYIEHCPNYLDVFCENIENIRGDVEGFLQDSGCETIGEYLNLYIKTTIYDACLFTALLYFIDNSTRSKSIPITKLAYNHSYQGFSLDSSKNYLKNPKFSNSEIRNKTKSMLDSYDALDKESDNLRKRRKIIGSKNSSHIKRKKHHEIAVHNEFVEALVYYPPSGTEYNYLKVMTKLNKLDTLHDIYKSSRDDTFNYRVNVACGKILHEITNIKYKDYISQSKFYIGEIRKSKLSSGIDLYRFELSHDLYRITRTVNELLEAESEMEIENILNSSYLLRDIRFPNLYEAFDCFDSFDDMKECVSVFELMQFKFVYLSKLIIDEFVDKGYFGDGYEWHYFFIDTLNKMSEKLLFDPENIDYTINSKSQEWFEAILSMPIWMYYVQDGVSVIDIMKSKV